MKNSAIITGFALLGFACNALADGHITQCDIQAAHPSDPDHVGVGRSSSEVVTHRAIPACRAALEKDPDNPRFHYQLGRAIVYWAGANDADDSEGLEHIRIAADMGYTQALFVLGLMYIRDGDLCAAEPVTKQAADQGLKSARISYVNYAVAGDFDRCGKTASGEEMDAYLDGAASQVSGWYENMLLGNLRRQLGEMED